MDLNELEELIEEATKKEHKSPAMFFRLCQKYASVYTFYKNTAPARNVLKNYLDDDQRLKNDDEGERSRPENLDIPTKLYVYYFWLAYKKYFQEENDKKFIKLINENDVDKFSAVWNKIFGENSELSKKYKFGTIISENSTMMAIFDHFSNDINSIDDLHFKNLFDAMSLLEKEIEENEKNFPSLVEGLNMVVSQEYIDNLTQLLELKEYTRFTIMAAPIARALTTDSDSMNSYIPNKNNKTVYFADKFRLNLTKLNNYMESFKELYQEFKETNDELLSDYESYI